MAGINKAIIVGNLGKDPEMRYANNGNAIANFSVATSETWKDKQSGEKKEKTEWHNCVAFGKVGEIVEKYLKKGSKVYIEGKIQTDKYQKDGIDMYSTKINVRDLQMLDSRDSSNSGDGGGRYQGSDTQANRQQGQQQVASQSGGGDDDFDDDIPFN